MSSDPKKVLIHWNGEMNDQSLTKEQLEQENDNLRRQIRELRETESRYRNLVENSPDFIFYLDNRGRLISMNESGMLGYTADDKDLSLGRHFADYIYPDDREMVTNSFLRTLATRQQITKGLVFRVVKKGGEVIWVELHSRAIYDDQGNYLEEVGILRDVTERKRMDERLLTLNQELEKTNRDLRTAYQWMRSSRDILLKRSYEEAIGFLVDRTGRIDWISEAALSFTCRSRTALLGTDLAELLQKDYRPVFQSAVKQAWMGIVYPVSVAFALNEGLAPAMEMCLTRVSSTEMRRLWVRIQYPTVIIDDNSLDAKRKNDLREQEAVSA